MYPTIENVTIEYVETIITIQKPKYYDREPFPGGNLCWDKKPPYNGGVVAGQKAPLFRGERGSQRGTTMGSMGAGLGPSD